MRARWILLVAVLAALDAGCGPKVRPGLNAIGAPAAPVAGGAAVTEPITRVTVTFDRPVVGAALVGHDVSAAPLRLRPEVPGRFRWLDARVLAFLPEQPLPRSTRFEAEVPAGTRALDGFGLAKPFRWSFETERLRLAFPMRGSAPPARWATPDQAVALEFNQPVGARDVEKRCAYLSEQGRIDAVVEPGTLEGFPHPPATDSARAKPELRPRVDNPGEPTPVRARFRVTPRAPLALATKWRFHCDKELSGAEGPLGLESAGETELETYGPLAVVGVSPRGAEISPDEAAIVIRFSNPLAAASGSAPLPIKIDPPIEGFPERAAVVDDRISYSVRALQPDTHYTITVDGSVADRFGQHLPGPYQATFGTGDGTPRMDVETGAWVVESSRRGYVAWTRNVTAIEADVAVIPEAKLGELARRLDWWDDEPVDLAQLGLRATHATIKVRGRHNQWEQVAIEPARLLGSSATPNGFYYVVLRAPEEGITRQVRTRELLLNFTNLGVTAKLAGPSGLVWVTRLSDGKPQPGAEVAIRDVEGRVRWRGTTGADGAVVTPGHAQLLPKQRAPAAGADFAGEGGEGEVEQGFAGRMATDLLIFARLGKDTTWVNPARVGGLAAWNFHVTVDPTARAQQLRGFLHTDRGLYRPGDTVRLRGLARTMKLGGPLRVPGAHKVRVTLRDPRGEEVLTRTVPLSRFGSFAFDVPLGQGARLGDYRVEAALPDGSFHERFSVEEYRPAAFEVKVPAPARDPVAGETLRLGAEARYLYGAPLRGGTVVWRVYRRARQVSFEALPGYEFGDARAWDDGYYDGRSAASEPLVSEEEQRLDKDGRAALSLALRKDDFQTAQDLLVTAEVQDETHQTIAANVAIPAHRAGLYFGIDPGSPVAAAGAARAVRLVALDTRGGRIAAGGTFRVVKRTWSCAYEAWGYHGSYRCEKKDTEIVRQQVSVRADAPAEVRFTPPDPGTYFLVAEGTDAAGNGASTAAVIWSWGDGDGGWQADDSERFDIVADKARYKVGESARLLLKTPVREATALLTIERDGVVERRLVEIGAGTSTIDVPIHDSFAPNVYASVVLVKGRTGKGPRGLPIMRMGMASLAIDVEGKRLAVAVGTDRPSYRPGETITAELRVTDAAGKPVQAEVALAAADEGVLSLIGFKTPDPLGTFYAPWGLGVTTATQYERLARLPEPGEERYATGGDGAGEPGTFRARFLATAYWNPRIVTDADGRAKVTFKAPDNLTAYRLMAVAADAGERFGSGERRVTVRKPLQLLGAMPRFLNVGDDARGGVVVINDTGKAGTATIEATVAGARLRGPGRREIELPANGRVPVAFAVHADRAGQVRLRVKASLGDEHDGLELRIPVHYPAAVETEVVAEGHTTGEASIPVRLPGDALPASVSLEVSTDPDGVAGLEEGLRDLIEYPYGCLEQTTSRLIPLVAVEELARSLKLQGLDGPDLQRFIRGGLERLEKFQTDEGGYSLWFGGKAEPYLTAFALWGLKVASDAGHPVPKGMIDGGVRYLRAELGRDAQVTGHVHAELGEMGSRAFAVHVLALLGQRDTGYATKLLEKKAALPRFGEAFLARALAFDLGPRHPAVTGLLDDLAGVAEPKGVYALIREPGQNLGWYMSDDVRTTAIATDAFLDLRPSDAVLPKLVKALFGERRNGRWQTTQDNLYALVALVHFAKTRGAGSGSVEATLGDRPVLAGDFRGKEVHIRRASLALDSARPPAAPLVIRARDGGVFYSALVRFRRDVAHQKPYENRITVRREYLDPATDVAFDPAKGIKVGSMVRVRVTVSSPDWRAHLAVDDPLPAGLEAVNTRLVTSAGVPKPERRGRREHVRDIDQDLWQPSARELRDDRVLVFVDGLPPGPASFDYLARATTPGTFVLPGTSAGEMYQPEIGARTAPGIFVVREK